MNITIQPTESLTGTPLISIWFGNKQVILQEDEFKRLKEEISSSSKEAVSEVTTQEWLKNNFSFDKAIEEVREKMHTSINVNGKLSPITIELSKELDKLIVAEQLRRLGG